MNRSDGKVYVPQDIDELLTELLIRRNPLCDCDCATAVAVLMAAGAKPDLPSNFTAVDADGNEI